MQSKSEAAVETFNKGFNCAQSVFSSHSAELGLDAVFAKKIGGAFGGGLSNNGEVCGAVAGALMLIGLKYGQHIEGDKDSKNRTGEKTNEYIQRFRKEYGSITCRGLLKLDLSIKEDAIKARESGVFKTLCPVFVKRSVELVEEIL